MASNLREVLKKDVNYSRPTGRLAPDPAALAFAHLELAALEYWARRGESILLYEDAPVLWRFALPRAGWWRQAQRARLPTRPLSQSHSKREESRKRQAWLPYCSWSRFTSGVWLSVIGAVQYGTAQVFSKVVPHVATEAFRPYIHQVMALCARGQPRCSTLWVALPTAARWPSIASVMSMTAADASRLAIGARTIRCRP